MTDQNPIDVPTDASTKKSRFSNPFRKNGDPTDSTSKLSSAKEKAKTVAAVIGVVATVVVVAGSVAKRRGIEGIELSLPDVDTTDNAS